MQVRQVAALTGWRWVVEGFTLLAKAPLPLAGIGVLMLFTLIIASVPRMLGTFMPLLLSPALSFGYLQAIRQVQEGKQPRPGMLFSGLRPSAGPVLRALLLIGIFNAVATAAALLITVPIDDGQWLRMLSGSQSLKADSGIDADSAYAALLFMTLYAPTQVALWYAPLFAGLHRTSALKSLVFSAIAVWRNKGAFFVYFGGWFAVAAGLSIGLRTLATLLPGGLGVLLLAPASILMLAALYCSFWPTYRDTVDPVQIEPVHSTTDR